MEKIKGLAIELDLDHLSVDRGLKGLKDNLKTVNAEMKRNMSAFDFGERSVKKYETRLSGLNKKLEVQKQAVAEAKKEYEEMVKEHGRGSEQAEKAAREYNNQAAALNNLERYIEITKNELIKLEQEQRISSSRWTKFGDKLEKASNKLQTASQKMGKVGSTLTSKITKPAVGAAGALTSLALFSGFRRLIGIDTAKAQLKALGHDAETVEQIMTSALNSVKGTSFGLDEAATTAASAVAAGVKPTKELEKYLSLAADTASVANVPFNEMGDIFNKVQTSGKAQNDVLKQLSQRGIPIYQYLGETIGKSTDQIEKMARDGKIKTKDFLKAVEKNIGGASKIIGEESFAAAWKNIASDIGRIGANFLDAGGKGGGFFSKLKPLLVDFRKWLEKAEVSAADLGVKFGEAFENMIKKAKDLKRRYDDLNPKQQEFIKKVLTIGPAVAIGAGPAITIFSKLTAGVSGVLKVSSKLTKAIGIARSGAGLAAALASLGPGMIAGLAVAGLGAVATAAYTLYRRKKKANEVSLDLAESLTDEALALEESANVFDKLSGKAKISNEQLAELNDLNIRISKSSNPGEIKELKDRYKELAEKSGLSKDELKRLFEANKHIIDQTPDVEKSISDQGNAFAKNTDAVKEYIGSLYDLSRAELKGERLKNLKNEEKIRKNINELTKEHDGLQERIVRLIEAEKMAEDERKSRIQEIAGLLRDETLTTEEQVRLQDERNDLVEVQKGKYAEVFDELQKNSEETRKQLENEKEKLQKIEAFDAEMANILLKQVGISEEGEKGLKALDKSITKNDEELAKLDEKLKKNGKLTEKEQERYDKLSETSEKQREVRDLIFEEYGIYHDINSLAEHKIDLADKETKKKIKNLTKSTEIKVEEGNIVKQLQNKNTEHDKAIKKLEKQKEKEGANKKEIDKNIEALKNKKSENNKVIEQVLKELGIWDKVKDSINLGTEKEKEKGKAVDVTKGKLAAQASQIETNNKITAQGVKKEQERTKEAGKPVTKNVTAKDNGTVAAIDKKATTPKNKTVNLQAKNVAEVNRLASSPVEKVINFVGRGLEKLKFWEKGTPPSGHPGGPAVIGEKGSELVRLPSGKSFLSPNSHTLLDLPRGTQVIPHQQTKRIVRNAPRYADGTDGWAKALGNSDLAKLLMAYNKANKTDVVVRSESDNKDNKEMLKLLMEQNEYLKKSNELLTRLLGKDLDLYKLNRKVDEGLSSLGNRKNAAWGG